MKISRKYLTIILLFSCFSLGFALPFWSNFRIERTAENQVRVYVFWNETNTSNNLSYFIASWNYSSMILNDTPIQFNTTPDWSNVTKTLNSTTQIKVMLYANNSINEWNATDWSNELTIDISSPEVFINTPTNNTIVNKNWIIINYTTTDNYAQNLNCSYNLDGIVVYDTILSNSSSRILNLTNLSEGIHLINITCVDEINLSATSNTIYFIIDTIAPTFSNLKQYPARNPNYLEDVLCTVTWNDVNLTEVIFSSNYSGIWSNYTITSDANEPYNASYKISTGNWSIGKIYAWKYYAKDAAGNINETPMQIYLITDVPSQQYQLTHPQLLLYFPTKIVLTQASFYELDVNVSAYNGNLSNVYLLIQNLNNSWYQITPIYKNITINKNGTFNLKFLIPLEADVGSYNFSIFAIGDFDETKVNSNQVNSTLIINRAIPSLNLSLTLEKNEFWAGDFLNFIVNITNNGQGGTNILLEYIIKKNGNIIEKKNETQFIEKFIRLERSIPIPSNIQPGFYELLVSARYMYEQKTDITKNFFVKRDCINITKTNFLISADVQNKIEILLKNNCSVSLHNLKLKIDGLNYTTFLSILERNTTIYLNLTLGEGIFGYVLNIEYDEGASNLSLNFNSRSSFYVAKVETIREEIKKMREEIDHLYLFPKANLYNSLSNIEFLLNKSISYLEIGDYASCDKIILAAEDYVNKLSDEIKLKRSSEWIGILVIIVLVLSLSFIFFGFEKKIEKERIAQPKKIELDLSKIPKSGIYLGKLLNVEEKAYFNENKLMTHTLIAGSTGSGKSVTAMIIAEELLKKGIPVIVLDPTLQWTGFMNKCDDNNMLKHYKEFGLKEPMSFATEIVKVNSDTEIKINEYLNKAITVLCLNELNSDEFDKFVSKFLNSIFDLELEESENLRLLIVVEEVHRLLPKYGGKKAYLILEKSVREFRKWGIGLLLTSQVLTDFKAVIRANVETEIQFRTSYEGDINRVKEKYSTIFAKMIPKLKTGIGMLQNPEYNNANPYFIRFRPLLHSPHQIPKKKIEEIQSYREKILELEKRINELGDKATDLKISIELAKEKLRQGMLEMVRYYIEDIEAKIK
jgi:hypothetical protein